MNHEGDQPQAQEIKNGIFIPTSRQFAEMYKDRSVLEALDEFHEQVDMWHKPPFYFPELSGLNRLASRHGNGWVINADLTDPIWEKIQGRVIPLRPAEGKEGLAAQKQLAQQIRKHGLVMTVIARMPGGQDQLEALKGKEEDPNLWSLWDAWDSGFIAFDDLDKPPQTLFAEFKAAVIERDKTPLPPSQRAQLELCDPYIMKKLALAVKTPEEKLADWPSWPAVFGGRLVDNPAQAQLGFS